MKIDITSLAQSDAPSFSGSRAELGENAAQITWANNMEAANLVKSPLLDTDDKKEAFRDFVKSSGGWTRKEIDAWDDAELNALFHQWVMGDVRESPAKLEGITFREESPDIWYHENESTPDMETGPFDSRHDAYEDATNGQGHWAECLEDIDWDQCQAESEAGRISSRIYFDGQKYWFELSE